VYDLFSPSPAPKDIRATHEHLNIHPGEIQPGDRYQYSGRWLTVHDRRDLRKGDIALDFVELVNGALEVAVIPEGTMGVTVYRPKAHT
jgi:hypothetical protein